LGHRGVCLMSLPLALMSPTLHFIFLSHLEDFGGRIERTKSEKSSPGCRQILIKESKCLSTIKKRNILSKRLLTARRICSTWHFSSQHFFLLTSFLRYDLARLIQSTFVMPWDKKQRESKKCKEAGGDA